MVSPGFETAQTKVWQGDFGREYTDRNTLDTQQLDRLWTANFGVPRSTLNQDFLKSVAKDATFLEVGCNIGNQLLMLDQLGYGNLSGVEIQSYALNIARERLPRAYFHQASALDLPFEDDSFDVVFTSGVLIHIAPEDLPRAIGNIHRCARNFIWGAEYFSEDPTMVKYREHERLLWKMNYAQLYLSHFADLELVKQQRLPYLENENVDSMFLLRKNPS
jgi:pseudaminic acid biosynthesis-associated methylase